ACSRTCTRWPAGWRRRYTPGGVRYTARKLSQSGPSWRSPHHRPELRLPAMKTKFPEPRLLLGPGPSPVHPRVLAAMSRPPIGYLDPELFDLLGEIQTGLRRLFRTENPYTLAVTGTGMAGMQFCLANLIEPGE